MYSASMVDNAVIVCILDAQVMGAPAKCTIQLDQDLDVIGSIATCLVTTNLWLTLQVFLHLPCQRNQP